MSVEELMIKSERRLDYRGQGVRDTFIKDPHFQIKKMLIFFINIEKYERLLKVATNEQDFNLEN